MKLKQVVTAQKEFIRTPGIYHVSVQLLSVQTKQGYLVKSNHAQHFDNRNIDINEITFAFFIFEFLLELSHSSS